MTAKPKPAKTAAAPSVAPLASLPFDLLHSPASVEEAFEWCRHAGVSARFTPHLVVMQLTGHPEVQAAGADFLDALEHLRAKAMPTESEISGLGGKSNG